MKPHRATAVLVLGILGIISCPLLGLIAWVMGNNDLRDMNNGLMDPGGRDQTNAGRICGIIGTVIFALALLVIVAAFGMIGIAGFAASQVNPGSP